ncbi:MAG: urate hydroxylase PuuD [Deltaproteobacteria bacterium]|nr:urate hydroxylase PuuD [Deltaproteobacteria bacterium]
MNGFIDFLSFTLRWTHVFAAILWVGSTYLFNFMEKSLERDETTPENVRGRLWMVHGGGFYFVEKQKRLDGKPRELHWFKYESATTWVSGALLIGLVFYHGGGANLVAPGVSFGAAATAGLLTIIGGWLIYDLLVRSPLGRNELFVAVVGWCSFVGLTYLLWTWLSPRAVLVHIGGMIGTIMAANVWMRILPSQKRMLAAVAAGKPIPTNVSATGPLRSKQNSYLAIPLVLLMLSNHSSLLMDRKSAPIAVGALFLVGWAVARAFRGPTHAGEGAPDKNAEGSMVHAGLALGLLIAAFGFGFRAAQAHEATSAAATTTTVTKRAPKAAGAAPKAGAFGSGKIQGTVAFGGAVPAPDKWTGTAECAGLHEPTIQLVRVKEGKLADAFVYVKAGLPEGDYAAPSEPVVVGQKSCEFTPRVFGAMAGQPISFGNDDPTQHNVQGPLSASVAQLARGQVGKSSIDDATVMATLTCSMHSWMRAYAGVLDHPFFAVSDEDGRFAIERLPDGEYTLGAWHEKLGATEVKVKIEGAAVATAALAFAAK